MVRSKSRGLAEVSNKSRLSTINKVGVFGKPRFRTQKSNKPYDSDVFLLDAGWEVYVCADRSEKLGPPPWPISSYSTKYYT